MKALFKPAASPGFELVDRPEPEPGPGEVKIRVLRTGICGTDLHILEWDAWAASAVNAPLIPGHEFCGEVVEIGAGVRDVHVGALVSGEGHVVCGTCRNCRAGRRHLCIRTSGVGVNRDGAFAEYVVLPESNVWVHRDPSRSGPRSRRDLRPVRQRCAHRAVVPARRRGRADHRCGPDRLDGRCDRAAHRRAVRRHHRRVAVPARPGSQDGRRPRARRLARVGCLRAGTARHGRGIRRRARDERAPVRAARHHREPQPRRPHRHARTAQPADRDRVGQGRHPHDHDQGHLRPRDVRDLVRDVGDAAVGSRHLCCRHAPTAGRGVAGSVRDRAQRAVRQGRHGLESFG